MSDRQQSASTGHRHVSSTHRLSRGARKLALLLVRDCEYCGDLPWCLIQLLLGGLVPVFPPLASPGLIHYLRVLCSCSNFLIQISHRFIVGDDDC